MAAGKSTRMKSVIPKATHPICGRPMLNYVLDLAKSLKIDKTIAVLGYKQEEVRRIIRPGIKIALQRKLLGTADAVKAAMPLLKNFKGTCLILYADNPLLKIETLKKLLQRHAENNAGATLLTAKIKEPAGYGRVLRDKYASICAIAEEKDADEYQKDIKEINTGIMCFNKDRLLDALKTIRPNNRKKEYYLTDAIGAIYKKGGLIENVAISDAQEALGINSRPDLSRANAIMQQRINRQFMDEGVTILGTETVFINYGAQVGQDTMIYPFTVIESDVKIGKRCYIGPFVHLREGSRIEDDVALGNFLEVARSRLGPQTLVKHFGYIGDARIGRAVNIGAGTVTANFDGRRKNTTTIKDGAFIGSDTILVAPVKIGKRAVTGAGTVILKNSNVGDGKTVVGVPARVVKKK